MFSTYLNTSHLYCQLEHLETSKLVSEATMQAQGAEMKRGVSGKHMCAKCYYSSHNRLWDQVSV